MEEKLKQLPFKLELERMLEERASKQEQILADAFMKHFGYPYPEAAHPSAFERVVFSGDNIEQYKYMGETFLVMERECRYKVEKNGPDMVLTASYRYMEV